MKKRVPMILLLVFAFALVIYGLGLRQTSVLQRRAEENIEMKRYGEILEDMEGIGSGWSSWTSKFTKNSQALRDYNEGVALFRLGDYERAKACFEKASKVIDPALKSRALYNYGNVLLKEEDFAGAAEKYIAALAVEPDDFQAKTNLESMLMMQQQIVQQSASAESKKVRIRMLPWKELGGKEEEKETPPEQQRW